MVFVSRFRTLNKPDKKRLTRDIRKGYENLEKLHMLIATIKIVGFVCKILYSSKSEAMVRNRKRQMA